MREAHVEQVVVCKLEMEFRTKKQTVAISDFLPQRASTLQLEIAYSTKNISKYFQIYALQYKKCVGRNIKCMRLFNSSFNWEVEYCTECLCTCSRGSGTKRGGFKCERRLLGGAKLL